MASACTNLTGAARAVQLLKIDAYSATTTMGASRCMKSSWTVGGYEWEIHLYPATCNFTVAYEYDDPLFRKSRLSKYAARGKRDWDNYSEWVALKLVFLGEPRMSNNEIRATIACRLVDQRGEFQPSQEKRSSRGFMSPHDSSDPVVLIEKNDLAESGYLSGDSLAVECSITVLKQLPVPTIPAKTVIPPPPSTNLHLHFGELLQSGIGADVTFIVSGESFAAHKPILSARSPVFMAEFFGEMKEKCSQRVEIEDMEAAVFKALLHFIYTDTVPELDQELEEAVATMAQHLLAAADRYGLGRLKLICESKLSIGITIDTAATTLALADQHNCSQLKAKCVEFIVSTPAVVDAVLATQGFKHLAVSCPLVLADLLKFALGERVET